MVGRTHRHDRQPIISGKQVLITGPPEDLSGSRAPLLIKFHGESDVWNFEYVLYKPSVLLSY